MEQIPTEVMEKIKKGTTAFYGTINEDYFKDSTFHKGAEFGYRLATPCALCEGKGIEVCGECGHISTDKLKELQSCCPDSNWLPLRDFIEQWLEEIVTLKKEKIKLLNYELFPGRAELKERLLEVEKKCEGKEKEIAELKAEKTALLLNLQNYAELISSLEAEKERLKGLIEKSVKDALVLDATILNWNKDELTEHQEKEWQQFKTENNL